MQSITRPQPLTKEKAAALLRALPAMPPEEQEEVLGILEELEERERYAKCRSSLIAFAKEVMPSYSVATHHKLLAGLLTDVSVGTRDRITVSVPPRHGKSTLSSIIFPAWFLGNNPTLSVIMISNTTDLATDFGAKVRDIISLPVYKKIFPNVSLSPSKKAAGRWDTNQGGEFFAAGTGASIAGRGGDIIIVDDPHNEQDIKTGNYDAFDKDYLWFTSGLRTRLMSKGRIVLIHCMTGDTKVLLASGGYKLLRDVRPGDIVASYKEGRLVPSPVINWANQGVDRVYTIKTTSGKIVRANERHPFLVNQNGVLKWTKVKNLKTGMLLTGVSLSREIQGSNPPQNEHESTLLVQKHSAYRNVVKKVAVNQSMHSGSANSTTIKTGERASRCHDQITGEGGGGLLVVLKGVWNQLQRKDFVKHTTREIGTLREITGEVLRKIGTPILSIGTVSALMSTTVCLLRKMVNVLFACARPDQIMYHQIGMGNSGLTIAIGGSVSEHCYATPATLSLVKGIQKKLYNEQLSTYEPTLDEITDISFDGYEEVFDIQVAGTENFIANGLVSHNTRWHQRDLIGRVIKDGQTNSQADQYEVYEFPAILPSGRALWPEKFSLQDLERTKASMPVWQWNAQYMQQPTAAEAALIKRDWWRAWAPAKAPECEYIIMTLDAAAEKHNRADYSALLTFGVFRDDNLTKGEPHIILLNAINVRLEFPELKSLCLREYKDWQPDAFIVEKKSAGTQLYQEFRRLGVPVQEFNPSRATGDKIARVNAISDIISSGMVWYPEGRRWAEDVVEQCVSFPVGEHDDMVDCVSLALSRFRQGGFITLPTDDDFMHDPDNRPVRNTAYYRV